MNMKIILDSSVDGKWLKAGVDIKDGDRLKVLDAGQVVEGKFGEQYVFKFMTSKKEEGNIALNRTSRNTLGRGFSTETEEWVGKVVKAFVVKQMVGDGLKNVLYLAPDGWEMNDDGEFYNPDAEEAPAPVRAVKTPTPIAYPEDDINPDSIPF